MKFLSESMTSASGSIGGATYSHNRFGMYRRARRVPVNPNTTFQQSQRDAFTSGAALWRTITAAQRAAWESYAASTPVTNSLGQTVYLTGFQQFVASQSLALRYGLTTSAAAPTTAGRSALGMPTLIADASASTVAVSSIDPASAGAWIGLYLGDAVSAGVSFFAGPYQLKATDQPVANAITYTAITGRNGVPLVAGQRLPYRLVGVDDTANNRLTQVAAGITTVVA